MLVGYSGKNGSRDFATMKKNGGYRGKETLWKKIIESLKEEGILTISKPPSQDTEEKESSCKENLFPLSHVFHDNTEKRLYNLSQSLSCGININLSFSPVFSGIDKKIISTIYLDVDEWDANAISQIEGLFKQMGKLKIVTKTPKMVFPWVLQFQNLYSLVCEERSDNPDQQRSSGNIPSLNIDMNYIGNVALFDNLREICLYQGLYSDEGIKQYMLKVFEKLKQKKCLKDCIIMENATLIKERVFQDYMKSQART